MSFAMLRRRLSILPSPARSSRDRTIRGTSLVGFTSRALGADALFRHRRLTDRQQVTAGPHYNVEAGRRGSRTRCVSAQPDHAVVESLPAVDDARALLVGVVEEVEVVSDQFHLVEGLVDRHRLGGVL